MTPQRTPAEVKDLILKLDAQHPAQWTKGAAYPAKNPVNNKDVLIRRSTQHGVHFLHIYVPVTLTIKTPSGEVLSSRPSQAHYRANLHTYELVEVN